MHDTAIELLIIGNNPSEIEGYLTALRNAGIAVHSHRVEHDLDAVSAAGTTPIDLILYTIEPNETSIAETLKTLLKQGVTVPLIALSESCDSETKASLMSQGACDLVERKQNQLLSLVLQREYYHLTQQREIEASKHKLKEYELRCNLLTESSRDAIAYIHEGMHVKANSAYLELFGLAKEDDIEGLPILDMIAPSEQVKFKKVLRKLGMGKEDNSQMNSTCISSDGSEFNAELSFLPAIIDDEPCTQVIILNQSSAKEVEEKLRLLSTQDIHTGLYNRQHFFNMLGDVLASADDQTTLFYITLDDFKEIRDAGGILVSDSIISEVAALLKAISSENDLLARFGDHTFTLLTKAKEKQSVTKLAKYICLQIENHQYKKIPLSYLPTCSIGVVSWGPEVANANDMINLAYQACDQARNQGGNQVFFAKKCKDKEGTLTDSEADLVKLIEHAFEHDQFRLVYQPIVSLHGDSRENYAVLVRLLDNNQEEIHPDQFLAQTEAIGKMPELDRWVIRQAISELAKHRAQGEKITFFINISGPSLRDDRLLLWICDCLREFEAKGSWLVFQIHDAIARSHVHEIGKLLDGLKKIKCKISIDHFGLAPKPEALLRSLPIDFVQFDPQLLVGLTENQEKQDRLNELNRITQKSNIKTVTAGVDEANSLAILWSIGVNYIRGHFIQEPSPTINYDFKPESSLK